MKYTGVIRVVDKKGKIKIPYDFRRILGIKKGNTFLKIYIEVFDYQKIIILKKCPKEEIKKALFLRKAD